VANEIITREEFSRLLLADIQEYGKRSGLTEDEAMRVMGYRLACTMGGYARDPEIEAQLKPILDKAKPINGQKLFIKEKTA
jgi:hypothetical protein